MDSRVKPDFIDAIILMFIISSAISFLCSIHDISVSCKEISESLHTIASMKK